MNIFVCTVPVPETIIGRDQFAAQAAAHAFGERDSADFDDWFSGGRGSGARAAGRREFAAIVGTRVSQDHRAREGYFAARFADQRRGSLPDAAEAEPAAAAFDARCGGGDYFERRDQEGAV